MWWVRRTWTKASRSLAAPQQLNGVVMFSRYPPVVSVQLVQQGEMPALLAFHGPWLLPAVVGGQAPGAQGPPRSRWVSTPLLPPPPQARPRPVELFGKMMPSGRPV